MENDVTPATTPAMSSEEESILHHPDMIDPLGPPPEVVAETPETGVAHEPSPESEVDRADMDAGEQQGSEDVVEPAQTASTGPSVPAFTQTDVDLAAAQERIRAQDEHVAYLREQQSAQLAADPQEDPLVQALTDAGIDPDVLENHLDRRQEDFLRKLGDEVQQQNDAVSTAHANVAAVKPGFDATKLDAWMADNPAEAQIIQGAQARDLEAGLLAGWTMLEAAEAAQGTATAGTGSPVAPKTRTGARTAGVASAGQKIGSAPAASDNWDTMSSTERRALLAKLDKVPEGSAQEKALLRKRFPQTAGRVEANRGNRFAFRPEDY